MRKMEKKHDKMTAEWENKHGFKHREDLIEKNATKAWQADI